MDLFDHLEKIITTNWKVFESVFQDQPKIAFRLRELEGIRNSIAHTRRLSQDGKEEKERGIFTVIYEWEEVEPGLFSFVGDPVESK